VRTIFFIVGLLFLLSATLTSQSSMNVSKEQSCTPPLAACNKPVKWVADKGACSCFACEYGKVTQHVGCTNNNETKAALRVFAEPGSQYADVEKFSGTVAWTSDTATLTDKDGKSWEILNPDALKGYEGRHVRFSGLVNDSQKNAILVTDVKNASDATPAKKKD
jgi:hypothetical protein